MRQYKGRVTIDIWDNGGRTIDRYFIAISGLQSVETVMGTGRTAQRPYTVFLLASANPFHPQGFGQHNGEILTADYFPSRLNHMGHRIDFLDLPPDVQRFIRGELTSETENNRVRDVIQHVRDAITATPAFGTMESISGAEVLEWFGAWRENAVGLLAELDKGVE